VVLPTSCVAAAAAPQGVVAAVNQSPCIAIEAVIAPTVVNPAMIADLKVVNPAPGGGTSNTVPFTHPCTPHTATLGQLVNGSLSTMSCPRGGRWLENYRVDLSTLSAVRVLTQPNTASRVEVTNQLLALVAEFSGPATLDRGLLLPPSSGSYNFAISAQDGTAAGPFTFQVSAGTTGTTQATCLNTPWMVLGAQTSQSYDPLLDCNPFVDRFNVELQAGQQVNFDVSAPGLIPAIRVLDGTTGQIVRQDSNNGNLPTSHVSYTPPFTRPFQIQIFLNLPGNYVFHFYPN
jgi:hypothetical protein